MQEFNYSRDKREREAIHSGHFMVSHFEAEEQDDEDDVAVPVPETEVKNSLENIPDQFNIALARGIQDNGKNNQQLSIETNLSKLFQCMSLAYRQKLTSPKWNRFRGIKLRWKDKIRLNNVIWRCWHMQFIMKQNTLICQFASPLDVDTHNKPEAIVLEGKYWKRKLQAVTAEYKKWRLYYRNQTLGCLMKDPIMTMTQAERDALNWSSQSNDGLHMMIDEDYMDFMSDTLFSTISNQPFMFPDSREIAKAGLADFIQPSLGPLQPNLDDFMDTFEPLNDFLMSRLPSVPEEQTSENLYKPISWEYTELEAMASNTNMQVIPTQQYQQLTSGKIPPSATYSNEVILGIPDEGFTLQHQQQPESTNLQTYHSSVISKPNNIGKHNKNLVQQQIKVESRQQLYNKQPEMVYTNYSLTPLNKETVSVTNMAAQTGGPTLQHVQEAAVQTQTSSNLNASRGYKFSVPVQPNMKFSDQSISNDYVMNSRTQHAQLMPISTRQETTHMKKELETGVMKPELGAVTRTKTSHRGRRSRSSSRGETQTHQRPPLLTAVSDPAILTSSQSVLLTQLLTSNNNPLRPTNASTSLTSGPEKSHTSNSVLVKREENNAASALSVSMLPPASAPPPSLTTLIISTPSQTTSSGDQILLNSMSACSSPVFDHSSHSQDSPESPRSVILESPGGGKGDQSPHREQRRFCHIHAEQKRRYNIKNGFDMIHSLIPHLNQNPNTKLSKAAMLQKGADYIRQLRSERNQLKEEMDSLRQQIECLNTSISNCQSMLPATGAPVSRRRDNKMQEMFDEYVQNRTLENWKFWIFSLMIKPLLVSYNNFVSTSSLDDLYRTTMHWVEQHCTLVDLRPVVLNSLRYLCTKTEILSDPERLPDEARQAVMNTKPSYS